MRSASLTSTFLLPSNQIINANPERVRNPLQRVRGTGLLVVLNLAEIHLGDTAGFGKSRRLCRSRYSRQTGTRLLPNCMASVRFMPNSAGKLSSSRLFAASKAWMSVSISASSCKSSYTFSGTSTKVCPSLIRRSKFFSIRSFLKPYKHCREAARPLTIAPVFHHVTHRESASRLRASVIHHGPAAWSHCCGCHKGRLQSRQLCFGYVLRFTLVRR
jgi:hypothetical protein